MRGRCRRGGVDRNCKAMSRRSKLEAWLRERAPTRVELADFDELLALLAPVEESDLRHLLRESGTNLHPLVAGVDQSTLTTLRGSLTVLAEWYERGNPETRRLTRMIVIIAKDHAKLVARNHRVAAGKRAEKETMVAWMLTWLENPLVFSLWISLQENAVGGSANANR